MMAWTILCINRKAVWNCTACGVQSSSILASQVPTKPDRPPLPLKNGGFASLSGTTSGKSGVDMSTPVHPVATHLCIMGTQNGEKG